MSEPEALRLSRATVQMDAWALNVFAESGSPLLRPPVLGWKRGPSGPRKSLL